MHWKECGAQTLSRFGDQATVPPSCFMFAHPLDANSQKLHFALVAYQTVTNEWRTENELPGKEWRMRGLMTRVGVPFGSLRVHLRATDTPRPNI